MSGKGDPETQTAEFNSGPENSPIRGNSAVISWRWCLGKMNRQDRETEAVRSPRGGSWAGAGGWSRKGISGPRLNPLWDLRGRTEYG